MRSRKRRPRIPGQPKSYSLNLDYLVPFLIALGVWQLGLTTTALVMSWVYLGVFALALALLGGSLALPLEDKNRIRLGFRIGGLELGTGQPPEQSVLRRAVGMLIVSAALAITAFGGYPLVLMALLPLAIGLLPIPQARLPWDEYLTQTLRRAGSLAGGVSMVVLVVCAVLGLKGIELVACVSSAFYLTLQVFMLPWLGPESREAV